MDITLEKKNGIQIVCLEGNMDSEEINKFRIQFEKQMKELETDFILDLALVNYMSSMALGSIVEIYQEIQSRGLRMIVCGANDEINRLFDLTNMNQIINMKETVDDAIAALKEPR